MHLNNSKACADKIDMDHFNNMYELLNAAVRKSYLTGMKQKERARAREEDEKAHRRKRADEKQAERKKAREEDEEAHRRAMADEKKTQRQKEQAKVDARTRRYNFHRAVLFGPIFICSCCHRKLFENGVMKITEKFKEKLIGKKVPYSLVIPPEQEKYIEIDYDGSTEPLSGIYICHTCKSSLLKGQMPAMAVQNGLQLAKIPDDCHLTELENNLIAQMINFQYIYQLPKSRWGATKKQMISVPVSQDTLQQTINQLPRLPKDAGLIPVNLKRKQEYSNSHKKELIDPEKIMRVLQLLKESGHPYYQFCDDYNIDTYKKRCEEQDKQGYDLLFESEHENIEEEDKDKDDDNEFNQTSKTGQEEPPQNENHETDNTNEMKEEEKREDTRNIEPDEYVWMQVHKIVDDIRS